MTRENSTSSVCMELNGVGQKSTKISTITHCSPGETHDDSRWRLVVKSIACEHGFSDEIRKIVLIDADHLGFVLHQLVSGFAEYLNGKVVNFVNRVSRTEDEVTYRLLGTSLFDGQAM